MLKINVLASFELAVEEVKDDLAAADRPRAAAFLLAVGAAVERICETPGLGRSLGGMMFGHEIHGFPFAVIYDVTDTEISFLYLATA